MKLAILSDTHGLLRPEVLDRLKSVDAILHGEMKIHRSYMARLGITEEQVFAVQPALDNLSYTNYMLSVSHTGGPREIVAAILSCSWSYAEIGTRPPFPARRSTPSTVSGSRAMPRRSMPPPTNPSSS